MIEDQTNTKLFDEDNMNENGVNLMHYDNYNKYESPDNILNELTINEEEFRTQSAKINYEIKEESLNRKILSLERQTVLVQEENQKLIDRNKQIENDLAQQKILNDQFQLNSIQAKTDYDDLVSKLLLSFKCHSIDEVFNCSKKIIEMELKIDHLTQDLQDTQIKLSNITVNSIREKSIDTTNEVLNSLALAKKDEIDKLTRSLKKSNEKNKILTQEIELLKRQLDDAKQNNDEIQSENSQIKANSSNYEIENQELKKDYQQLSNEFNEFKIQQSKELNESIKRIKVLNQISGRFDPKLLMINEKNILYPVFENLSILLQSISDTEIDSQIIVQGIMQMNNIVHNAISDIETEKKDIQDQNQNNELISKLNEKISDYEDQIQRLQAEIEEMQETDAAPELLTWITKYNNIKNELDSIKHRQDQNQSLNHSFNYGSNSNLQSNRSVFLKKPT
ncbi:hypothetical protein M9Y10_000770 [Tritrichomonas musculus]|uniref:Uncharacterized protein n=1 Tax=Tritrichomonas musculus TaxID=1915356 RepID=A0ABR2L556_9EUKA